MGNAFEIQNLSVRKDEKAIDKVKSKRDRCVKKSLWVDVVHENGTVTSFYTESRRYYYLNKVVKRLEKRLRESTYGKSSAFAQNAKHFADVVVVGDYVPEATDHKKGKKYNRALNNRAMHGQFKSLVKEQAKKRGKAAYILDESGTTRTCHLCHFVVEGGIHPSIRSWIYPKCREQHHRDDNSCQNGLAKHLEINGEPGNIKNLCQLSGDQINQNISQETCHE